MRLTSIQRRVLAAVNFDAATPITQLAKRTKIPAHKINYHLARFRDEEILRASAFIDAWALGFNEYTVYFSLAPESTKTRNALLKSLSMSTRIAWYAELGGSYQYGMTLVARNAQEARRYIGGVLGWRAVGDPVS